MTKTRINPRIDTKLIKIMKRHCKCENINEYQFITSAIAEKLNVPLTSQYTVDNEYYVKAQLKEVENCIDKLEARKRELEAQL